MIHDPLGMTNQNILLDPVIPLPDKPYEDSRGVIQNLVRGTHPTSAIGSVVFIRSKRGAVRANHYHKTDFHYCYLLSGKIRYLWRPAPGLVSDDDLTPVPSWDKPYVVIIKPGQLFYTPPLVEHAMEFTQDSEFIAVAGRIRTRIDHEHDLVRLAEPLVAEPEPVAVVDEEAPWPEE